VNTVMTSINIIMGQTTEMPKRKKKTRLHTELKIMC